LPRRTSRSGLLFYGVLAVTCAVVCVHNVMQTREDNRIQRGPLVGAVILKTHIDADHQRSGTDYTTHLRVRFRTTAGHAVTTGVTLDGRHTEFVAGGETSVRYDPQSPTSAELPGHRGTRWIDVVMAAVFGVFFGFMAVSGWRARTRASVSAAAS
jgi:hypothetical protein